MSKSKSLEEFIGMGELPPSRCTFPWRKPDNQGRLCSTLGSYAECLAIIEQLYTEEPTMPRDEFIARFIAKCEEREEAMMSDWYASSLWAPSEDEEPLTWENIDG